MEKRTEKKLFYFLCTSDSDIFTQTLHDQVKNQRILLWLKKAQVMSIFVETATCAIFKRISNSSDLIKKN